MHSVLSRIPSEKQKPAAIGLLWVAGLLALGGIGGVADFTQKTETTGHLLWKETHTRPTDERVVSLVAGLAAFAVAAVCILLAVRLLTMRGGLAKYRTILAGVERIRVDEIANITGKPVGRVHRDLQVLIDSGGIEGFYVDRGAGQVISKQHVPKVARKTVVICGQCGDTNEVVVGVARSCHSCGSVLPLGV